MFLLFLSTPIFFSPSTDRMDFHKELHAEMSHPLGPTATAVQSLTVFFSNYKYLVVCTLLFFQKSAMATAHVKMSHSLPTSQTLSWGGALSPVWRRAGDPTPSPHPAGGSRAASSRDPSGRHPAEQEEKSLFKRDWICTCRKKQTHGSHKQKSPQETCKCVWCDSCPPLWQEALSP